MSLEMSQRDRRALVSGAILIAALITLSRGLPAWRAWRHEVREEAITATADLARARALLRLLRPLTDSLSARGDRLIALAPALLGGESPAAAGATLAGLLSGAAANSGVRLGAVQIRPDSLRAAAFIRISVRADATGDLRGVTRMLASLERGPTLLAVRALSIDQPEPGASHDSMEQLQVTIVVEGLMLTPREKDAKAPTDKAAGEEPSDKRATSEKVLSR